ncbi:MAG TPA: hypothetical protein VMS55_00075 [Myxococcota bacterium]|nr:hypothetical protein [Myxococcota bacterium]
MTSDERRDAPADTRRAIAEAARHARAAAAEAALAVRSLLDAAALFTAGVPAEAHAALSGAAAWLDALARGASPESNDAALAHALAGALDAEIERWEARALQDPDARAVLRAFLGVRELLWELGVRPSPRPSAAAGAQHPGETRRKRVERVRVQG